MADASFALIRPTPTKLKRGAEGRFGVQPPRTVERGTRDSSPQGWVYGVSGEAAPRSGPESLKPLNNTERTQ